MTGRSTIWTSVLSFLLAGCCARVASAQIEVRIAPIVTPTATPAGSERLPGITPPASAARIDPGSIFFVEIWATVEGTPPDGLACVHVDLFYDRTDLMNAVPPSVDSPLFPINGAVPVFDDPAGRVDDIGGCQTAPAIGTLGVGEWVLVEQVQMNAVGTGGLVTVSIADAGNVFVGTSFIGELQNVPLANIDFQVRTFSIVDCLVDGDCDVDINDFAEFTSCLTGPGAGAPEPCHPFDFDFDNDVDWSDFGAFQILFTGP